MKEHGGGILKYLEVSGRAREEVLDFSASINPLGRPQEVESALRDCLPLLSDYPEIDAASLRWELAAYHALPEGMILPANGSTALIYLLPRVLKPRRATLVSPCFAEYRPALEQQGCQVDEFVLSAAADFHFRHKELLVQLTAETELVWLANPGNPSGAGIQPAELTELAGALVPRWLVVDEAFVDFCPELSLVKQLEQHPNLILLRSMTKFYAIPGLRVGYLLAAQNLVARLSALAEPWSLSTPAIFAARACLAADAHRRKTLDLIPGLRDGLIEGLRGCGFRVFPSAANYLLTKLPPSWPEAAEVARYLLEAGVLVRCCSDFSGLDGSFLRFAVRTDAENQRLLGLLQELSKKIALS